MSRIVVVGAGAMGSAIVRGLIRSEMRDKSELMVVEIDGQKREALYEEYGIPGVAHIEDAGPTDMLVCAVKPDKVLDVVKEYNPVGYSLLVSVAAGISMEQLGTVASGPVARVMPNTPCLIGKGMSVVAFNERVELAMKRQVTETFACLGEVLVLPESQFDAATALSGCGPAYVYTIMEAFIDAGCYLGLHRNDAKTLVENTMIGAASLAQQQSHRHPAQLRDQVTSPGGVTIEAIYALELAGVPGRLWQSVVTAAEKSRKMSE